MKKELRKQSSPNQLWTDNGLPFPPLKGSSTQRRITEPTIFPSLFAKTRPADAKETSLYSVCYDQPILANTSHNNLMFPIKIEGKEIMANLDTGAMISTISVDLYNKLSKQRQLPIATSCNVRLRGVSGAEIEQVHKPVHLDFQLGGKEFSATTPVREHGPAILIGMDIILDVQLSFFCQGSKSYITINPPAAKDDTNNPSHLKTLHIGHPTKFTF